MKTMRIGITSGLAKKYGESLNHLDIGYARSLLNQGALPLVLPIPKDPSLIPRALDVMDGLLISGGADISPFLYGEHPMSSEYKYIARRDHAELLYYREAKRRGMPILGICRGLQLINVAEGGTLYQDIPTQVGKEILHSDPPTYVGMEHHISIDKESELYRILGKEKLLVNSIHHQAIKELGENLTITAKAPDGIIEGIEGTQENWLLAVQFHPERLLEREDLQKLFAHFVEVARRQS